MKTYITTNGTSNIQNTPASNGFQAFATGSWGAATIDIQISADSGYGWLTIATLTEDSPILEEYKLLQGVYLQAVVSNATITTNLLLNTGFLNIYQA